MAQHDYDIANGTGAAVRADLNNVLDAIVSLNSGATAPTTTFAYMLWYDTTADELKLRDGSNTNWITVAKFTTTEGWVYSRGVPLDVEEVQFSANDATPDVSGGIRFVTNNSIGTIISNFDGTPQAGWRILVRCGDVNTFISSALTRTGMQITLQVDDVLEFEYDGAAWNQVGGTVGMGVFVPLADPDQIGDWISSSTTSWTDVTTNDDGVRYGANAVMVRTFMNRSSGFNQLKVRKNGETTDDNGDFVSQSPSTGFADSKTFVVGLDNNAVFEARFTSSWTATTNEAYVIGYWI